MSPPTVTPNSHGTACVALGWALLAISTGVIVLRFYTRINRLKRVAVDDYLMLTAWLCEMIHMVFFTVAWNYGMGHHFLNLDFTHQRLSLKWMILVETFAISSSTFGRISFAIFFLHIIGPRDIHHKITLWGVVVVQIVANLVTLVQIYAQCGLHSKALWDPAAAAAYGHCQSPEVQTIIGFVQSALNSACDLVLTIIPVIVLWHLQMPKNQKLSLGGALCLSFFALGASIAKCVEIKALSQRGDITWYFINLMICVVIENNVVIIAASIPTLRSLMRKSDHSTGTPGPYHYGSSNPPGTDFSNSTCKRQTNISHGRSKLGTLDDNSEEYILQDLSGGNAITKTTNVEVAYEARNDSHDTEKGDIVEWPHHGLEKGFHAT